MYKLNVEKLKSIGYNGTPKKKLSLELVGEETESYDSSNTEQNEQASLGNVFLTFKED